MKARQKIHTAQTRTTALKRLIKDGLMLGFGVSVIRGFEKQLKEQQQKARAEKNHIIRAR